MTCVPKPALPKTCPCGAVFDRRRLRSGRLENLTSYAVRTECDACKPPRPARNTTPAAKRKTCEHCRETFMRRRYANGILMPRAEWDKQQYCTDACYNAARSEAARAARAARLEARSVRKAEAARKAQPKPKRDKAVRKPQAAQEPRQQKVRTQTPESAKPGIVAPALPLRPEPFTVSLPGYDESVRTCPEHPHERLGAFGCSTCRVLAKQRPRAVRPHGDFPSAPR